MLPVLALHYVEPFSNDDGELICEFCEVSGLVMFNPEDLDHLEQVREFARAAGLSSQLERQLHYLADYGHRGNQCVLGRDFAPHSFTFAMYRPGTKDARKFIFNGGLIFQGPSHAGRWLVPVAYRQPQQRDRLVLPYVRRSPLMAWPNVLSVRSRASSGLLSSTLGRSRRGPTLASGIGDSGRTKTNGLR